MYEGRQEAEWSQTSHILAGLYNIAPAIQGILTGKAGKERRAEEFMPPPIKRKMQWRDAEPPRVPITILKTLWVDKQPANVRLATGHNGR